jgi:dCTP deaminase
MLLTYNELSEQVYGGLITYPGAAKINEFGEDEKGALLNGASIDLTLGEDFFVERPSLFISGAPPVVDLAAKETPAMLGHRGALLLHPSRFCLAATVEKFSLPLDVAGHYMLKSSLARSGLNHLFAGFADPGWHGSVLTLELVNVLQHHALLLRPGMKIGQMVFWRGSSPVPFERSYAARGQYNRSESVQQSKGVR